MSDYPGGLPALKAGFAAVSGNLDDMQNLLDQILDAMEGLQRRAAQLGSLGDLAMQSQNTAYLAGIRALGVAADKLSEVDAAIEQARNEFLTYVTGL